MKLHYWTGFSKRKNSTKIPTATATQIDVYWKEDTTIDNPSVILNTNAINIDYCYIPDWGKYYFVGAPTILTTGQTQYDLEEDVMATHKTAIGNTVAHIVYSSTGYDTMIADMRCAVGAGKRITSASLAPSVSSLGITTNLFDSTGCYILTVANIKASENGFGAAYVLTESDLESIADLLMSMDINNMVIKSLYRPMEAIISCFWLPVTRSLIENMGPVEDIYFGDYHSTSPIISAHRISTSTRITNTQNITFNVNRYSDFRAIQPYTTYNLFIPTYGVVDLSASDLRMYDVQGLPITWSLDVCSGDFTVTIYQGSAKLNTFNMNVGVNCPIAQTSTNMIGSIASIGGVAGGLMGFTVMGATGNVPGMAVSAIGALTSASVGALNANVRTTSIKGSINGRSAIAMGTSFILSEYAQDTEDVDNANYIARWGRPVAQTHAINNHSGYVQCENASIDIAGDNAERETINNFLNSGFYYE